MNIHRIVETGLKCDFHIHSKYSSFREKDKITKENLNKNNDDVQKLINALVKNEIEIAAITDHDVFSFDFYKELKKAEGYGKIKKILPGVEFSVYLPNEDTNEKVLVHLVILFDDSDIGKVEQIYKILGDNSPRYDDDSGFSQNALIDILHKINLDVVFIAHQKKTITTSQRNQERDLIKIGENGFHNVLRSGYIQALEFYNKKNEFFNLSYLEKQKEEDKDVFITGSDCHNWEFYPYNNLNSKNSNNFSFTYLKCLPTFRGVALALTDNSRLKRVNSFFSCSGYLDTIDISVNDKKFNIPCSQGINVIIGDNSIGKSLILHKLTNYYRYDEGKFSTSSLNSELKNSYESYLKKEGIRINSNIKSDMIYDFDTQGEISKKFNYKKIDKSKFLSNKRPDESCIKEIQGSVEKKINDFFLILDKVKQKKENLDSLHSLNISLPDRLLSSNVLKIGEISTRSLSDEINNERDNNKRIRSVVDSIKAIKNLIEGDDLKDYNFSLEFFTKLLSKREAKFNLLLNEQQVKDIINLCISNFNNDQQLTDEDKVISYFNTQKQNLCEKILKQLKLQQHNIFIPDIAEENIEFKSRSFGEFKVVSKCKVRKINNQYFENLLASPLKKQYKNVQDFEKIFLSEDRLKEALDNRTNVENPLQSYKERVMDKLKDDFEVQCNLVKTDDDNSKDYSEGLNAVLYFKIISTDVSNTGIYIVDQPEDDISQSSIKKELIPALRLMAQNRQIFIITHNPQLVVNLDVDNVIYITRENDEISFKYGALEYQDGDTNILKNVADALDGGAITIKKRWQRYEKKAFDISG